MQPLFGCVVPGRPVITEFAPVSESKFITELACPTSVPDITYFMLPTAPIPEGYGAMLYYALPPFQSWELIGAVYPQKPSGIFRTGWTTNEDMAQCPVVQLGVSIEPMSTIANLPSLSGSGVNDRYAFAKKIADDLYQFMTSFSTPTTCASSTVPNSPGVVVSPNREMMMLPTNILDQWMIRFDRKYKKDPNFMMKS